MFRTTLLAGAALVLGNAAMAASVTTDVLDFRAVFGPDEPRTDVVAQSTSGALCDPFDGSGCDAGLDVDGSFIYLDWVDGDSFDIGISGDPVTTLNLRLTGLTFTDMAEITSVTYSQAGGSPANQFNIEDFLDSPSNPGAASPPTVSTSFNNFFVGNIFLEIDDLDPLLWGDAVVMRFDVGLRSSNVSTVPLPAGGALLIGGLLAVGALRRRTDK